MYKKQINILLAKLMYFKIIGPSSRSGMVENNRMGIRPHHARRTNIRAMYPTVDIDDRRDRPQAFFLTFLYYFIFLDLGL